MRLEHLLLAVQRPHCHLHSTRLSVKHQHRKSAVKLGFGDLQVAKHGGGVDEPERAAEREARQQRPLLQRMCVKRENGSENGVGNATCHDACMSLPGLKGAGTLLFR